MTPEEAQLWGRRLGQRDRGATDAVAIVEEDWKAALLALAESANLGTDGLEAYRAAFDVSSGVPADVELPRATGPAYEVSSAPAAAANRAEHTPAQPGPAIATPTYLIAGTAAARSGPAAPAALATPPAESPAPAASPPTAASAPVAAVAVGMSPAFYGSLDVEETAPLGTVPAAGALPFVPSLPIGGNPSTSGATSAVVTPAVRLQATGTDVTLPPTQLAQGPLLPFIEGPRAEAADRPRAARDHTASIGTDSATVEVRGPLHVDVGETLAPLMSRGPTLPFQSKVEAADPADETAFVSRDQIFVTVQSWTWTAVAVSNCRRGPIATAARPRRPGAARRSSTPDGGRPDAGRRSGTRWD